MSSALTELQENLQALQQQLQEDAAVAIVEGLALCQHFETHKHHYNTWLPAPKPADIQPASQPNFPVIDLNPVEPNPAAPNPIETSSDRDTGDRVDNEMKSEMKSEMKNAAKTGSANGYLSTAPVSAAPISTAPEEQMLSHYVELTKHMRLLAADFSMFRAARNPSTQKSRQQQIRRRLATLLAYCHALLAGSG